MTRYVNRSQVDRLYNELKQFPEFRTGARQIVTMDGLIILSCGIVLFEKLVFQRIGDAQGHNPMTHPLTPQTPIYFEGSWSISPRKWLPKKEWPYNFRNVLLKFTKDGIYIAQTNKTEVKKVVLSQYATAG